MPLPASTVDRKLLHTRRIVCEGYERADGLYDIEGWLTDVKDYPQPAVERGLIPAGEPMHGMGLRVTVDAAFMIHDVVAVMDHVPTSICGSVIPNFKRLIGVNMTSGFRQKVKALLGHTEGCTHLIDLLGLLATVAYQSIIAKGPRPGATDKPPRQMNSCRGWAQDGPIVRIAYPQWAKTGDSPER
ncbi:MAG: DUF2889 domain-containing protein [Rhodospirillaceae bacterium]|nr:MAG: DUF2889 domain-containing protein [Rhodospirillaceae bacterium]